MHEAGGFPASDIDIVLIFHPMRASSSRTTVSKPGRQCNSLHVPVNVPDGHIPQDHQQRELHLLHRQIRPRQRSLLFQSRLSRLNSRIRILHSVEFQDKFCDSSELTDQDN
jgi:hypothetical protein